MLKKITLIAACLLPVPALAGPYFLAGVASGSADLGDIEKTYVAPNSDDKISRALIGGGMDLNKYLAVEAVYMTNAKNTVENAASRDEIEHSNVQVAAVGKAPLSSQFSLIGKLSANLTSVDYTHTVAPNTVSSSSKTAIYVGMGAGAELQVNDAITLRLQAERIMMDGVKINGGKDAAADVNQASLSVKFNF